MSKREKTQNHNLEIAAGIGLFLGTLFISQLAFSEATRKKIGARDHWKCQTPECGKSFNDGWMVDAAHYSEHHSSDDPIYDTPEAGDIRCLQCHQDQHEEGTSLGEEGDKAAVWYLQGRVRRTFGWQRNHMT